MNTTHIKWIENWQTDSSQPIHVRQPVLWAFPFLLLLGGGQNLTASLRLETPLCGTPRILCLHCQVLGTLVSSLWQNLKIFLKWIPQEAHKNYSKLK